MRKETESDVGNKDKIKIVPFKNNYMKIFKGKLFYLLDPNRYDIASLMMLLDISKLNKLEEKFKEHKDGIEKDEFIKLMKKELPTNPDDSADELNLVYGLYKLFLEIDFNGDGTMQWNEFTQFIIDTVMGENEGKNQEDDDEVGGAGKDLSEKQLIKYKRYNVSTTLEDRSLHDTEIVHSVFAPKIDKIFVAEYKCKKIKIYNPKTGRADIIFDLDAYFKHVAQINKKNDPKEDKKKKSFEAKSALTFSILSLCCSPFNIISICLTNRKILFFEFSSDGKEDFKYEIVTPVLQKRVWYLPEHDVWFSAGMKGENDRYYYLNELDIEFEIKNQKMEIYSNLGMKMDDRGTTNQNPYRHSYGEHGGEILDVIEIKKPMLVLTACMDKIIRLISLNDKEVVGKWEDHKSAVRCLDYNPSIGVGLILSVGFEYYINVWSPEVAIADAFKGRLEGHYSPVIMCKFLSGSPMCVSVDEEGNVRVWDSRQLLCLQLISQEKKNFKVNKLLSIPKYNKFILYGNKIIFYDPKYRDTDIKPKNHKVEENYPIRIEFNQYYMNFYVSTMKDVKIYNSLDGQLVKSFKSLRSNTENDSKIKFFSFEDRYRKFYLGFSNGAVHQFNAGNGSLIKKVGEYEVEKDGITTAKNHHSQEVTNIFYESNTQLLLTTGLDSLINIYNEANPEESQKLRTIKGGHKIGERTNQIFCLDFSTYLNLFATGSTDGLVTVWDYELSKIDDVCYIKNTNKDKVIDVYSLKFLDPFPILAATYSDGTIYFWGVKPNIRNRGECFLRSHNYFINSLSRPELCAVYSTLFIYKEMDAIKPGHLFKKELTGHGNHTRARNTKFDFNKWNEELKEGSEQKKTTSGFTFKQVLMGEIKNTTDGFKDSPEDDQVDEEIDPNRYDNSLMKSYFIMGDYKGYIKILDIRGIVKKFEFEKATLAMIKSSYNIMKKDDINVEAILSHYLQKEKKPFDKFTNLYHHVIVKEFQAHDDAITNIAKIDEPFCFLTCSKDKKFKIWNFQCEILGEVNTQPSLNQINISPVEWKFKIDWEKLKEKEIDDVIEIYENVGGESTKYDNTLHGEEANKESENRQIRKELKKQVKVENIGKKKRYKPLEIQNSKKDNDDNEDSEFRYDVKNIKNLFLGSTRTRNKKEN
jgi:WD40 repeat protein